MTELRYALRRCSGKPVNFAIVILLFILVSLEAVLSLTIGESAKHIEKNMLSSIKGKIELYTEEKSKDILSYAQIIEKMESISDVNLSASEPGVTDINGNTFTLQADLYTSLNYLFEEKVLTLSSGEFPSQKIKGALVNETGRELYSECIQIEHKGKFFSIPIIGTYKYSDGTMGENFVFCDYLHMCEIYQDPFNFIEIRTESVNNIEYAIREIEDINISGNYTLTNKTDYVLQQASDSLENMFLMSYISLYVGISSCGIFILLIILICIKNYMYDMGLLLALGEYKFKIWLRFFLELMIESLAGIILSTMIYLSFCPSILNYIFGTLLEQSEVIDVNGLTLPFQQLVAILSLFLAIVSLVSLSLWFWLKRALPRKMLF
jgi:ABC-type transport system, involved in lipoprotein release, permease component